MYLIHNYQLRGFMAGGSAKALSKVGIGLNDLQIVAVKALTWTSSIFNMYRRRGRPR